MSELQSGDFKIGTDGPVTVTAEKTEEAPKEAELDPDID